MEMDARVYNTEEKKKLVDVNIYLVKEDADVKTFYRGEEQIKSL